MPHLRKRATTSAIHDAFPAHVVPPVRIGRSREFRRGVGMLRLLLLIDTHEYPRTSDVTAIASYFTGTLSKSASVANPTAPARANRAAARRAPPRENTRRGRRLTGFMWRCHTGIRTEVPLATFTISPSAPCSCSSYCSSRNVPLGTEGHNRSVSLMQLERKRSSCSCP